MIKPQDFGARCAMCPRKGKQYVLPEGPTAGALYVWLGQDPGEQDEKWGRPMIGPTGKRLDRLWSNANVENETDIGRREVLVLNTACCMPTSKKDSESRLAADCCYPLVRHFLKKASPEAGILAMGRWAFYTLTGRKTGVGKYQGYYVKLKSLRPLPDFEAIAKKQAKKSPPKGALTNEQLADALRFPLPRTPPSGRPADQRIPTRAARSAR